MTDAEAKERLDRATHAASRWCAYEPVKQIGQSRAADMARDIIKAWYGVHIAADFDEAMKNL